MRPWFLRSVRSAALAAAEAAAQEGRDLEVHRPAFDRALRRRDRERVGPQDRPLCRHSSGTGLRGVWSRDRPLECSERCFHHLHAPVLRVTGFDIPYPPPRLERATCPTSIGVLRQCRATAMEPTSLTRPGRCRHDRTGLALPDLGEGLTEAQIVEWKSAGAATVISGSPTTSVAPGSPCSADRLGPATGSAPPREFCSTPDEFDVAPSWTFHSDDLGLG